MPTLDRDGVKLFYEDSGRGDPPFVFVHGWTCDHTSFAFQHDHFSATNRVISVDLRGHGESDKPDKEYSISAFADDVAWLCNEVGVRRPVVVGHSMGGAIALELAARQPAVTSAVVLVDAAPIVRTPELGEALAGLIAGLETPDHLTVRRALIDGMLFGEHDDPVRRARITEQMLSAPQYVAARCFHALGGWDGEAAGRACTVPALHIGADNPINDAAALRALNPLIHTAQTVGAGHFNHLEVPDQVNAMIERFLLVSGVTTV